MDPTVLRGGEYGLETDIYCLGSTVWELITGKHPYHNVTNVQQLIETRKDASLPIEDDWPEVRMCY
jgi:serine/threonine protein kinase